MTNRPTTNDCCILNGGGGAWAFEPLAKQLSLSLGVEVFAAPRRFNYLLSSDENVDLGQLELFIPLESIQLAADKRLLAKTFRENTVPTPETKLLQTFDEVRQFVRLRDDKQWCLKYPTGCGGNGHRLLDGSAMEPANWPRPFIVQEFVVLARPEVYRVYCAGGEMFGWIARRFPKGGRTSPWVAHARGARYERAGEMPPEASEAAKLALQSTKLWDSFGCVDLLPRLSGEWVVLEVGTDGLFNHVDREVDDRELERTLDRHLADSFWRAATGDRNGVKFGD